MHILYTLHSTTTENHYHGFNVIFCTHL